MDNLQSTLLERIARNYDLAQNVGRLLRELLELESLELDFDFSTWDTVDGQGMKRGPRTMRKAAAPNLEPWRFAQDMIREACHIQQYHGRLCKVLQPHLCGCPRKRCQAPDPATCKHRPAP